MHHTLDGFLILMGTVALAIGCAPIDDSAMDDAATNDGGAPAALEADVGLDNLNAVLWVQTAVEYRATAWQAYELARRALDDALADPTWTAALEQTEGFEGLPPAVVLDIDETVLDNSYFEARLILGNATYSPAAWDEWVLQEAATPVAGALEFCVHAASLGVTVFYVSNRTAHLEAATRANLDSLGFPLDDSIDTVLLRGEIPEWDGSDKTPRRQRVADGYRVLMLLGDNMGDFTAAAEGSVAERLAFAEGHREYWGKRWIAFANPTYGSWLGTLLDNDYSMPRAELLGRKKAALNPRR